MGSPAEDALAALFDEAKDVVNHQVDTVEGLDDKAIQVARLSALVAGLVVTGISVVFGTSGAADAVPFWIIAAFALGFVALAVAVVSAIWAYQVTEIQVGLKAEDMVLTLEADLTIEAFHRDALVAYADGIIANGDSINKTATGLQVATIALLLAVPLLAAGAIG